MGSKDREHRRRLGSREEKRKRGKGKDKEKNLAKSGKQFLIDLAVAAVVVLMIMGGLFAYSGVWPPLVVVESGSMQHSLTESYVGVIDTGDLVVVKRPGSIQEITSYVRGRGSGGNGYSTYGEFGDVIVYRKFGREGTPVIHRALVWVQWNAATSGWDAPELDGLKHGTDWIRSGGAAGSSADFKDGQMLTLLDVGYARRNVTIEFVWLKTGNPGGFITLGDNHVSNARVDQRLGTGISDGEPVRYDWIVGVARGEIPCFGMIKLWWTAHVQNNANDRKHYEEAPGGQKTCAAGLIILIVALPLVYDVVKEQIRRRKVVRGELDENEELDGPFKKLSEWVKRKVLKRDEEPKRRRKRRFEKAGEE